MLQCLITMFAVIIIVSVGVGLIKRIIVQVEVGIDENKVETLKQKLGVLLSYTLVYSSRPNVGKINVCRRIVVD